MKMTKELRKIFQDERFINRLVEAMTIATMEFQLNWKHQIVNSPLTVKGDNK